MLPMPHHARALVVGALLLSLCSCGDVRREQPKAIDGILDLSDWDFEKDGIVELNGQWFLLLMSGFFNNVRKTGNSAN